MSLRLLIVPLLLALPSLAGDDWSKVKELPSGSDLKIFARGSVQPRIAKYADATDSSLIVVVKNEQVSIPKDDIDRIEARPPVKKAGKKMVSETHVDDPAQPSTDPGPRRSAPGSSSYSTTTSISSGDKGEFSTVYRRVAGAPAGKSSANPEPR